MRNLVACLVGVLFVGDVRAGDKVWSYAARAEVRPVYRFVPLAATKPEDLREDVRYRGTARKYAQVRYGSDDSRRVVVVVDEVGPAGFDLYVDADRDRVIGAKDRVAGAGKERAAPLDAETPRGTLLLHERRTVQWRLGAAGKTIGLATLGHVGGSVVVAGKRYDARRVDGNANGFFADAADRLWIDLDGDGRWDPLGEQFPFAPVLTLNRQRYGVRGDAAGTRLAFEPLTSEGRVRLRLGGLDPGATVLKVDVMLAGEDGSAFAVSALDTPSVLPTGRYAVGSVALSVLPAGAAQPTHFVFSHVGVGTTLRWRELKKDEELTLDPIGTLRFALDVEKEHLRRSPGQTIRVQPQLFTADGLLINSCSLGDADASARHGNHRQCTVTCRDAKGQALDRQASGFA
jgi:hypothetical protein